MDPRFVDYYNQELLFIRESAAEFAREFPKIAGRLAIDGATVNECGDPYVERLLEGFAFMAARVQLKLDSEFPRFTQHLTEVVFPDYLAPVPAMAIVRFAPQLQDTALIKGFSLPRGSAMRGRIGADSQTACEFRTAHAVTLWPIEVAEAKFLSFVPELPREFDAPGGLKSVLRLRLRTAGETKFNQLDCDELDFYLSGDEANAAKLYEHLFSSFAGLLATPVRKPARWFQYHQAALRKVGFSNDEALLPPPPRSFGAYRLLREYAAFPQRFLFFRLSGLREMFARCPDKEIELYLLLKRADNALENVVDAKHFTLYASPAINLFPKAVDRIQVTEGATEYHVVPDRTRPMDFEVFRVTSVSGHGAGMEGEIAFRALYASIDEEAGEDGAGFYTLRRDPRVLNAKQRRVGTRSKRYIGTEIFLSIVEIGAAPHADDLKQLSLETLCTNRDLPILSPTGDPNGDFTPVASAPVRAIHCIKGPSDPVEPTLDGSVAWRLISHLSLNYLSLTDTSPREGAAALREMLHLYGLSQESVMRKQLEGIQSVSVRPIIRRMPSRGPVTFGRGFEIELAMEDRAFEGTAPFVLAAVLEEFFARHASINAFTETVLRVGGRGEIMRWPARFGTRPVL